MKTIVEKAFGKTALGFMAFVNPIKKLIIKPKCISHKYINNKALQLLRNEGYEKEYRYYYRYIENINAGVTWADQDLKSVNHFYHFEKRRGLYGFSNALEECKKYYNKAISHLELGDVPGSMFFFGAACHLIQDATVPQHVNNKLLKKHRNFELWIIGQILSGHKFQTKEGIKRCESVDEYIKTNALIANKIYFRFNNMKDKEEKYMKIASLIIKEAQMTTAGFMLDFNELLKEKLEY